jgi:hypothetical protein
MNFESSTDAVAITSDEGGAVALSVRLLRRFRK